MISTHQKIALASLILVLVGCGGGSSNNNGSESEISGLWASFEGHNFFIAEDGNFVAQIFPESSTSSFLAATPFPSSTAGQFESVSSGNYQAETFELSIIPGTFIDSSELLVSPTLPDTEALFTPIVLDNDFITSVPISGGSLVTLTPTLCDASAVPGDDMLFMTLTCDGETTTFELFSITACPDISDASCSPSQTRLYDFDSSLSLISGQYEFGIPTSITLINNTDVGVSNTGEISGRIHSLSDCAVSGQMSVIDSRFNLYQLEWTTSNCTQESQNNMNWDAYAHVVEASSNSAQQIYMIAYSNDFDLLQTQSLLLRRQ